MKHVVRRALFGVVSAALLALGAGAGPVPTAQAADSPVYDFLIDPALATGTTICTPIQQVAGVHGGTVMFAGSSSENDTGQPILSRWTLWNGTDPSTLTHLMPAIISAQPQITVTVPIGSWVMFCDYNGYDVSDYVSLFQSETY